MPARTGAEYLAGLKRQEREIWMDGRRVDDVTEFPGLANGARSIAQLYNMQHDGSAACPMTYSSPTTGDPVGLSFLVPKTKDDLVRRREMMSQWAHASYGMMGRTPDFLNATIMSMAAAGDFFGEHRPEFKKNVIDYYEYARDNDLCMTHTLVNLQRNRAPSATSMNYSTDVALHVVKETDAGLVIRGPRVLATLGPLSDEIMVYPTRSSLLARDEDAHKYAFAFAVPCGIDGLKFICRESFDLSRSHFDHPLGSRFEEMDAIVFFDDVLVPWERVFMYGDRHKCNNMSNETGQYVHTGHQVVTKNVAKCEFITGIASLMVKTLGNGEILQVQGLLAELVENLEITRALLTQSEVNAKIDDWGVMLPDRVPLNVARNLFIKMYPRMAEIIQLLGSSSLMALPSEGDFGGPMAEVLDTYLDTDTATAQERVRLFRLAWDAACSSFAGRQVLYERYFQGDWMRNAALLLGIYNREPLEQQVREFLERD